MFKMSHLPEPVQLPCIVIIISYGAYYCTFAKDQVVTWDILWIYFILNLIPDGRSPLVDGDNNRQASYCRFVYISCKFITINLLQYIKSLGFHLNIHVKDWFHWPKTQSVCKKDTSDDQSFALNMDKTVENLRKQNGKERTRVVSSTGVKQMNFGSLVD